MAVENTEKEDKLLIAKAEDAMRSAERKYMTMTVGFLNPRQRTLLKKSVFVSVDYHLNLRAAIPRRSARSVFSNPNTPIFRLTSLSRSYKLTDATWTV